MDGSHPLLISRGLRQGCALSMPVYVLTAEILALRIACNPWIQGITPPGSGVEVKLSNTLTTLHSPCVTTSPYRKPFTPYRSTKRPPAPKSTLENVKDAGLDRLNTILINSLISTGTTPIFLKKSSRHFLAMLTVPILTLTGNSNPSEILSPHGNTTNLALKAKLLWSMASWPSLSGTL